MDPYASKAYLLFKSNKLQESVELYTSYLDQDSNNAQIFGERAVVYFHLKQFNLAIADCNKAVELNPGNAFRYASRAFIKDAMGNTESAIEDYQTALALDPNDAVSYNNLGLLQEKLGYNKKAKQNFNKADEIAEKEQLFTVDSNQEEATPSELNIGAQQSQSKAEKLVEGPTNKQENLANIAAKVFTNKSVFGEFMQFVRNGFKLK